MPHPLDEALALWQDGFLFYEDRCCHCRCQNDQAVIRIGPRRWCAWCAMHKRFFHGDGLARFKVAAARAALTFAERHARDERLVASLAYLEAEVPS